MKNLKKLCMAIAAFTVVSVLSPIQANAAWVQDSYGWWFTEGDSWATGWRYIDGKFYYFYSNGYMAHDTYIQCTNGKFYVDSTGKWVKQKSVITRNK